MVQKRKMRVLLVDDSAETREYLRRLLQFESYIELVGMAANGKDAVDLAMEHKPDLILMDINMPVMDGISAAEIIFRCGVYYSILAAAFDRWGFSNSVKLCC